ncbi:L-fucose kinase [Nematostella vectensis]|uniref:L-fucose kinase n=1 Tax=Nematostella vectensis TaxID=45351 RepID=UPI002077289C|nr:L-fucose kinase [Nematostella vectensis]
MNTRRKKWSAIVLTCQNKASAHAFNRELELCQKKGLIDKDTLLLALEDPKARVGSGGATLNALLVVTEHLSAQAGFLTVESKVLRDADILIMHMGRNYPFSACGRAFTTLPAKYNDRSPVMLYDSLVDVFGSLLYLLTYTVCPDSPSGVWVCSTDQMLSVLPDTVIDWSKMASDDIVLLLFGCSPLYARSHGVCKLGAQGEIKDIFFRETDDKIKSCSLSNGNVPVVGSPVFFSLRAAEKLLSLHNFPPLDACTYYGLDNGASPIQLALVFDIMLSTCTDITEEDFVRGTRSTSYGKSTKTSTEQMTEEEMSQMAGARSVLWRNMRGLKPHGVVLQGAEYHYMASTGMCYRDQLLASAKIIQDSGLPFLCSNITHIAPLDGSASALSPVIADSAVVLNSIVEGRVSIGENAVISHCHLEGGLSIGPGCVLTGIGPRVMKETGISIPPDLCLLGYNVCLPNLGDRLMNALVVFGVFDDLECAITSERSTFCNKPWEDFFQRTGLTVDDIWMRNMSEDKRCLMNARLFPIICPFGEEELSASDTLWLAGVTTSRPFTDDKLRQRWFSSLRLSLKELLSVADLSHEFEWRRSLWFEIGRRQVEEALVSSSNTCFLPFFKSCAKDGFHKELLEALDKVACTSPPGIAARTLACIADVLGAMTGDEAGLRSGPAGNVTWRQSFQLLERKRIKEGVAALAAERTKWIDRPDLLIRAARHYEGAEQILRKHAVMSTQQFIEISMTHLPPMGHWVIAEAPVRIDLSGGWSDTPPIAYEHGGSVTNVAIKLNGEKPIQVQIKRIPEPEIVLVINAGDHSTRVVCKKLEDMADYSQPHAPGALGKACFFATNLLTIPSTQSLANQLKERYQGGFEIHSRADVPYGSGLGTSSILAGAFLGALLRAAGRTAGVNSLIHSVMIVEQMLTCGGGWQDNVGGLVSGFKCARSRPSLPMEVTFDVLRVPDSVIDELNRCLVFVYTGKTRLAKNLLQGVVRNWYSRQSEIVQVVHDLVENSEKCAKALERGDLEDLGKCVYNYREQKKIIAPGTEPDVIKDMMELIAPYAYGQCLTGAGGGGFMYIIAKSPAMAGSIKDMLKTKKPSDDMVIYDVSIDNEGLIVRVEPGS